jgi:hypothetical protein
MESISRPGLALNHVVLVEILIAQWPRGFNRRWGCGSKATTIESAPVQSVDRQSANPCKLSLRSVCENVEPGGGRIKECMREHWNEIAPDCRAFITEKLRQTRADHASNGQLACRDDARAFCADVMRGGGRIIACLRTHADQLQAQCRRTVEGPMRTGVSRSKI